MKIVITVCNIKYIFGFFLFGKLEIFFIYLMRLCHDDSEKFRSFTWSIKLGWEICKGTILRSWANKFVRYPRVELAPNLSSNSKLHKTDNYPARAKLTLFEAPFMQTTCQHVSFWTIIVSFSLANFLWTRQNSLSYVLAHACHVK